MYMCVCMKVYIYNINAHVSDFQPLPLRMYGHVINNYSCGWSLNFVKHGYFSPPLSLFQIYIFLQ